MNDVMSIGMALAAVAWADGSLDPREIAELKRSLRSFGLREEQLTVLLEAAASGVFVEDVHLPRVSLELAREIVAHGRAIARSDGNFSASEGEVLIALFARFRQA